MPAFRSLSTRLAVQFALLFAAAMIAVSIALSTFIAGSASHRIEQQMATSGMVYDRLWQERSAELQGAAQLMSRDFGFRSAVATGDSATLQSALANAAARLRVRSAYLVGADGQVFGLNGLEKGEEAGALWNSLDSGKLAGVAVFDDHPRQIVAAPIMAPTLLGWVVFAADLDAREMRSLEELSAIPLQATIITEHGSAIVQANSQDRQLDLTEISGIERRAKAHQLFESNIGGHLALALAKPLATFDGQDRSWLVLSYPKARALADARNLQIALTLVTLVGLVLVVLATWRSAGQITRPLARLDFAAERLAAGETATVEVRGTDELSRLAGSFNDMARKILEREKRITQLAFNDVLTELPNRTMFQQQMEQLLRAAGANGGQFALHCLDLDHFKVINDTLGHPAGDSLLIETARRVTEAAKGHFVARLGGDEFVILQTIDPNHRGAVDQLARSVLARVAQPFAIDGNEFVPSTSIGIAIAPGDGGDGETLLRNADLALYRAKGSGRNVYAFFEEQLNERAQARRQLENDLRLALERGEFELFYQPLFDLERNCVCSLEALLRWNHPERGLVSPGEFIPVAEDTGLIVQIGNFVIREACLTAAAWPEDVRVAVNVSPIQFQRGSLQTVVVGALAESGLRPDRLEVEITESIFLEGTNQTLKLLHALRSLGVRIALDDFGTGYSSLSYLQSFPFDKLKIDRSFIQNLLSREGAGAIVKAITDLAHALKIETTAEGVEETAQLMELRSHGCSSVQGFLFSKPMRRADVEQLFGNVSGQQWLLNVA